jgi:hypothetical protein
VPFALLPNAPSVGPPPPSVVLVLAPAPAGSAGLAGPFRPCPRLRFVCAPFGAPGPRSVVLPLSPLVSPQLKSAVHLVSPLLSQP